MPVNQTLIDALLRKRLPDVPELAGAPIQPPPDSASGSVPSPTFQIGAQMQSPQISPGMPEDPRLTALNSQLAQMDAPQKPSLLNTLFNAARGLTTQDPAQFQQLQQQKLGQEFAQKQAQRQNLAQQITQILQRQHQDTDDARQQEMLKLSQNQDAREAAAAPVALAHTAAETNRLNAPELGEIGPGGTVYDKTTGVPKFTSGAAAKSLQTKEIQDPQNPKQALQANFDPASGKTTDPRTGQEIPNPVPYQKPTDPGVHDLRVDQRVDNIRNQYNAHPVVKQFNTMNEALQFAKGLDPNTANPSDDQGLIYAFAKAMDPGSVVREGEYNTVQRYSQSWADKFGFDAKRIFSNTAFLTPEARANMKTTIESRVKPVAQQYRQVHDDFAKRVQQVTGKDGNEYIPDYGAAFDETQPPAPTSDGWSVKRVK